MGQFYPTIFLKKIAELPEYESGDDSNENTKSCGEENKSNSYKLSNEQTASNELIAKTQVDISKGSMEESSSVPSSVSSRNSSVKNQETLKRVSNISVESINDYHKRKSQTTMNEVECEKNDTTEENKYEENRNLENKNLIKNQNIFGRTFNVSESSDSYTCRSAPKFGEIKIASDRGSLSQFVKASENSYAAKHKSQIQKVSNNSILNMAVSQDDLEHQ